MHNVRYQISTDIVRIQAAANDALEQLSRYSGVLDHVKAVEFTAQAFFEAEESTCWIITVTLKITGKNDDYIAIDVDRTIVHRQPRYSYNDWQAQRDSDRDAAQKALEDMAKKWECKIIPIKE